MENKIPKRILNTLINALSAGVVPRTGAPYVAIGRDKEIAALLSDLETIDYGGSTLRFLIGKYGSGKSFLLQLIRGYALEKGFVTADADLSPERRLSGTNGSGIATYRELIKNLSSKTSPDGGALPTILSKWLSDIQSDTAAEYSDTASEQFKQEVKSKIYQAASEIENKVGGFDFATILNKYYKAVSEDDDNLRSCCLKWLRGEYHTKTESKRDLGVSAIINDENWYDYLKLMAVFVRKSGYRGLMIYIDECVNLYKISNRISRENNYEKILSIFNDTLQGKAPYTGFVFVGTPQFLEDTRRGLFSYEALRSRLADSPLISTDYKNLSGPILRLIRLTDNELFALLSRINKLYSELYNYQIPLDNNQISAFLQASLSRAGADSMITPREIIRGYLSLLHIIRQNPELSFERVLKDEIANAISPESSNPKSELEEFEL